MFKSFCYLLCVKVGQKVSHSRPSTFSHCEGRPPGGCVRMFIAVGFIYIYLECFLDGVGSFS